MCPKPEAGVGGVVYHLICWPVIAEAQLLPGPHASGMWDNGTRSERLTLGFPLHLEGREIPFGPQS